MLRRQFLSSLAIIASAFLSYPAAAQDTVKIGLIIPMTGQQGSTGKQIDAAVKLYQAQHGTTVAGKKVEVIVKDDAAVPDNTKRIAQELIVNDKVNFLAGFGVTPAALAAAPLATQAKVPEGVMAAGGEIVAAIRVPLANPDFAPFLQRAADAKPDALFIFVPSGQGGTFVKQFVERGLDKAGVKLIGPGDVTDDDLLPNMGDAVIGAVTAHMYSAAHPSPKNKEYVAAFEKAYNFRPNF